MTNAVMEAPKLSLSWRVIVFLHINSSLGDYHAASFLRVGCVGSSRYFMAKFSFASEIRSLAVAPLKVGCRGAPIIDDGEAPLPNAAFATAGHGRWRDSVA